MLALTDRARQKIDELNAEFRKRLDNYRYGRLVISLQGHGEELTAEYNRRLAEIIREGTTETRTDRTVRVRCPKCKREELIAGDVERWTCICGKIERFAYLTYI